MINKVFFDVTNCCNGKCVYCFTDSQKNHEHNSEELGLNEIEMLIDDFVLLGVKELSISGGEPFLRDMCRIFAYNKGRLNLSITTNGTILNDTIITSLAENNVGITVSLDAIDQNISDLTRCGIDVNLVIKNIERLLLNPTVKEKLSIRTTVSKYNIKHLFEIIEFCKRMDVPKLKINSVNSFGRAKEIDIAPDFSMFMKILDSVIDYCTEKKITTKISLPVEKYLAGNIRTCTLGDKSIYIDSIGDVYPCAFSERQLLWGNLRQENIFKILNRRWSHNNRVCANCPINRYQKYKARTI